MNKKLIKLVSLPIQNSPQAMPLAAGLLKAKLDGDEKILKFFNVLMVNSDLDQDFYAAIDEILAGNPDLVGFSVYVWNRKIVEQLSKQLRKKRPELTLFAGGAEATADPGGLLESAHLDFVIAGEGEEVLSKVLERLQGKKSLSGLPGVYFTGQNPGEILPFQPVWELDLLPSPYLTGVLLPQDYPGILWELSRGCSFACDFCFESKGQRGVRRYGMKRLEAELRLFEERQVSQIFVLDPTFNQDKKRAKELLRLFLEVAPFIHYTFEVRTEFLDEEIAELFASLHCSLQIGLQSADPKVLAKVNRPFDPVKYAEKIDLLNQFGVTFGLDLIYGLPGDTLAGFQESMNYAISLQPNHLDVFPLAVLPGTRLFDRAGDLKLDFQQEPPYAVLAFPTFSSEDMQQAQRLKTACELFYNQGGAVGWLFMVLETLQLTPAEFFALFGEWLEQNKKGGEASRKTITSWQREFCEALLARYQFAHYFPVLKDIISFHGAMNHSLWAGPCPEERESAGFELEQRIENAPGTVVVNLSYHPDALMSLGELNFEEFLESYEMESVFLLVYNGHGSVKTLLFNQDWMEKLLRQDEDLTLGEIFQLFPENEKDMSDFVEFGLEEGIFYIK